MLMLMRPWCSALAPSRSLVGRRAGWRAGDGINHVVNKPTKLVEKPTAFRSSPALLLLPLLIELLNPFSLLNPSPYLLRREPLLLLLLLLPPRRS